MATVINNSEHILSNYQQLWDTMFIRDSWKDRVIHAAHTIEQGQEVYLMFCRYFNPALPWYVVGLIHMMECSCSFNQHLHNGNSLKAKTVDVPKGRPLLPPLDGIGKPYQWKESAMDALRMKSYDKMVVWDIPHILERMEKYNGLGYQHRGMNTPYLWSGTNHYTKGKYTSDGHFDLNAVSAQVGAAAILKILKK
jgi:lysozyme family protein